MPSRLRGLKKNKMETAEQELYNVRTETFEGPLDLLLHLIKKNKMDILDIKNIGNNQRISLLS